MNDEKGAMDFYRKIHWVDGVFCPRCKSNIEIPKTKLKPEKRDEKNPYVRSYYCKNCKKKFNDFTGTKLAGKKVSMGKILYILINEKTKTKKQIAKDIGFSRQIVSKYINILKDSILKEKIDNIYLGDEEVLKRVREKFAIQQISMKEDSSSKQKMKEEISKLIDKYNY